MNFVFFYPGYILLVFWYISEFARDLKSRKSRNPGDRDINLKIPKKSAEYPRKYPRDRDFFPGMGYPDKKPTLVYMQNLCNLSEMGIFS